MSSATIWFNIVDAMSYKAIRYTKNDHVGWIRLYRPRAGNRLNQQMAQELADICTQVNRDEDIYVAIVTGAGKTFCIGGDYQPAESLSPSGAIAGIGCPVIAAINGDAFGQGLELALACDIRLASNTARFGLPQITSGLIPMDGGTQRLPRIIGKGKALELILTGKDISAEEALEMGLVNKVVPAEKLHSEAKSLAETIASKAPIALKYAKEAISGGLDLTLEQGLRLEADLYFLLHTTADRDEGIKAFLEKRRPDFRGV